MKRRLLIVSLFALVAITISACSYISLATQFEAAVATCTGSMSNGARFADCGSPVTNVLRDAINRNDQDFVQLGLIQDKSGKIWNGWKVKGNTYYLTYPSLDAPSQ
jgi:hypothetical protein